MVSEGPNVTRTFTHDRQRYPNDAPAFKQAGPAAREESKKRPRQSRAGKAALNHFEPRSGPHTRVKRPLSATAAPDHDGPKEMKEPDVTYLSLIFTSVSTLSLPSCFVDSSVSVSLVMVRTSVRSFPMNFRVTVILLPSTV